MLVGRDDGCLLVVEFLVSSHLELPDGPLESFHFLAAHSQVLGLPFQLLRQHCDPGLVVG